ncbi:Ig-like domain-containing protein [Streptomyces sp. NPDC052051]|uniref:L,D-transpeptidase n=1 Tax=Streptomyces sp. NPDC052051 TaxID=3154649 RepID=UPI0034377470
MSHSVFFRRAAASDPRLPARAPRHRKAVGCALLAIALGAGPVACGAGDPLSEKPYDASDDIDFNVPVGDGKKADPDKPLEVSLAGSDGRITDVTTTDARGRHVAGELTADGSRWHSTSPLAAGTRYTVQVSTEDDDGAPGRKVYDVRTSTPETKKRLNVTFGPKPGTYGVGQPVTAELSEPVKDKASRAVVERALKVDSQPAAQGSWYWVDDKTLHYRPKDYWPAHATVTVHSNLADAKISDHLWGADTKPLKITTGDRVVAVTDAATHLLTVYKDDKPIRQIPVTTGRPGYATRNGVKVILGKQPTVRMRGTSIGIAEGSSDSYDLLVHWAAQVTYSGEYVHAAPWSVGSQGYANVSHGCTGMSNGNAQWFYDTVRVGDVVKVINSGGEDMAPFGNGFGDWNLDWTKWRKGSALVGSPDGASPQDRARLRPEAA